MSPNVPSPYYFLVAAGLCFGLQNKVGFLHGVSTFTDNLLTCSYCTGFHCGWMTWLLWVSAEVPPGILPLSISLVSWCFACAWTCYFLDLLARRLEIHYG